MEYATELVVAFVAFVSLIQIARQNKIQRPVGKVDSLGIRYTLQDFYSSTDIEVFMTAFREEWLVEFPSDKKVINSFFKSLNIFWYQTKPKFEEQEVLGFTEDLYNVHLWIGPKLKSGDRYLPYTGLMDQITRILCRLSKRDVDKYKLQVQRIVNNVYRRVGGSIFSES